MLFDNFPPFYFVLLFDRFNAENSEYNVKKGDLKNHACDFMEKFKCQLKKKHEVSYIKQWTVDEEQMLLKEGPTCSNWKKLSTKFYGKSAKICKRRYLRLIKKQQEWPKEDLELIKDLKKNHNKCWKQIQKVLKQKNPTNPNYTAKKIRQKYVNYLEQDINRNRWAFQQDLLLWNLFQKHNRNWGEIQKNMPERSSIQIRNRYYKFIEPLANQVYENLGKYGPSQRENKYFHHYDN